MVFVKKNSMGNRWGVSGLDEVGLWMFSFEVTFAVLYQIVQILGIVDCFKAYFYDFCIPARDPVVGGR